MDITAHLGELHMSDAQDFREIVRLLRARPEVEPSPGLHDRVLAQLPERTRRSVMWWRWGAPLAASLVVLLALAGLLNLPSHTASDANEDIRWLAENQEADGTWDPARHGGTEAFRPALTALAVLALQFHAESSYRVESSHVDTTRFDSIYTPHISKGIAALAALQTEDGSFGGDSSQAKLYNLAMATYTLAQAQHSSTATLSRAIACLNACQQPDGSWTYAELVFGAPGSTHEGNAAITAWMTRALAIAEAHGNAGATIPLRKGLRWLRDNVRDDGRMAYHPASAPSDTLTALSAHSLIEAGKLFPDLQALGIRMTDAINIQPSDTTDCYRDYAKILAFESAGKTAKAESVRRQLRQNPRSQDPWRIAGGQLYTAALTTLCRVR